MLNKCWRCGAEAGFATVEDGFFVRCDTCGANNARVGPTLLDGTRTAIGFATKDEAADDWNTRTASRTCHRKDAGWRYTKRRYVCSVCGYGLGDGRWSYCPKCGSFIESSEGSGNEHH